MLSRVTKPMLDNQWYLKVIGDKVKLTHLYFVQEEGWEEEKSTNLSNLEREIINDKKLRQNLFRARNTIFEYAYCNEWDYFFTGTLDQKKIARDDLSEFEKKFSQMVRDERKKGYDIQYLIVPELHSDLHSWHCHGLLKGLPSSSLRNFKGEKYNWLTYEKKFGFNSLENIRSHEAVSKYMTKYVTKCYYSNKGVQEVGKHLYLVSRGLKKGLTIKKGSISHDLGKPAFSNDFCEVYEYNIKELDFLLSLYNE